MTFYDVVESKCRDMAGNVRSENGSWYWQDFDIDQMRWNGTMYVFEVDGDIILTNRDIAL